MSYQMHFIIEESVQIYFFETYVHKMENCMSKRLIIKYLGILGFQNISELGTLTMLMAGFFYSSKRCRIDRRIRTSDDLLYKHKVIFGTKIFDDVSTPFRHLSDEQKNPANRSLHSSTCTLNEILLLFSLYFCA